MENSSPVRLLLVEDDEDDAFLARELLDEIGSFDVDWIPSYEAARAAIETGGHDVYLFDYHLGAGTGLDLLEEVARLERSTPVILLTGQGDHRVDLEAMRGGAADYLPKDRIDAALLERSIRYALERARLLSRERDALAAARGAVQARDEVLRIVSHDLGNSLSAVGINAAVLLRTLPPDAPEETRERIRDVRRLTDQMQRLRQDLLDVASIEAGRLALDPSPLSAASLVEDSLRDLAPLAQESGIALQPEGSVEEEVHADPARIRQLLQNLVGNALKFTPPGGSVRVGTSIEGSHVRFTVQDSGPGISPEHLPHVFDRFWQARHTRRGGAGLGLAISRGIVDAHGGQIGVESRPGEGACFSFTLPRFTGAAT